MTKQKSNMAKSLEYGFGVLGKRGVSNNQLVRENITVKKPTLIKVKRGEHCQPGTLDAYSDVLAEYMKKELFKEISRGNTCTQLCREISKIYFLEYGINPDELPFP